MPEACSTSDTAFLDYGLPNGRVLVPATYYVLAARDEGTFEPTPEYVHRIADAFRTAFVRRVAAYTCTYLQWYPDGGVGVDVEG